MVEVYISINNNEEVIQLPVPPEKYRVLSPFNNESFEGLSQVLNLITIRGLKELEISSFFPIRDYPFLQNRGFWGMEYVDIIERWRDRRLPIRLIIVSNDPAVMNLNMAVAIDNFDYETRKCGDIYYSMSLRQFTFPRVGG